MRFFVLYGIFILRFSFKQGLKHLKTPDNQLIGRLIIIIYRLFRGGAEGRGWVSVFLSLKQITFSLLLLISYFDFWGGTE